VASGTIDGCGVWKGSAATTSPRRNTVIVVRAEPLTGGIGATDELRLHVLGRFEIVGPTEPPAQLPGPAQRLAAFLAVHDEPVGRSHVAGVLWPEVGHDHALSNLRTALWRLRTMAPGLVRTVGSGLRRAAGVVVDLQEGEALAHRIMQEGLSLGEARGAAPLLSHDLLPDWEDEWLVFDRERFLDLRVRALERLCGQLSAMGDHAEAAHAGLLAIQGDPLRESASVALMHTYIAEGNEARALQLFRALEHRLEEELQVSPSPATADLARQLQGPQALEVQVMRPFSASG
jgi:DNA-binding SARP family transcriptional activator